MLSMTGYGKASGELPGKKITVELRSLNSRQFDLSIRVPGIYREKESGLRTKLSKQTERGKIDFSIYSELTAGTNAATINKTLAKSYYSELKAMSDECNEKNTDLISLVLKMPDVLKSERQELDESEWITVRKLVDSAIADFRKFRADEGKV